MEIKTKALPLLAISDHISRNSAFRLGALVGYRFSEYITIADAFDVKHDSVSIEVAHFEKKIALLQTVSPSLELLGWYSFDENTTLIEKLRAQLSSLNGQKPLVFMVSSSEGSFKCFCFDTGKEIPFTLVPGESEVTAVSTVQNHAHYSQKETDLIQENETNIGPSLHQLEEHVSAILAQQNLGPGTERLVVHLAQLVLNYQGDCAPENYHLYTAQLSLLASQIATSNCANTQIDTQAAGISKRRWLFRDNRGK